MSEAEHTCPECGRGMGDARSLMQHRKAKHGVSGDALAKGGLLCGICGKKFRDANARAQHHKAVHEARSAHSYAPTYSGASSSGGGYKPGKEGAIEFIAANCVLPLILFGLTVLLFYHVLPRPLDHVLYGMRVLWGGEKVKEVVETTGYCEEVFCFKPAAEEKYVGGHPGGRSEFKRPYCAEHGPSPLICSESRIDVFFHYAYWWLCWFLALALVTGGVLILFLLQAAALFVIDPFGPVEIGDWIAWGWSNGAGLGFVLIVGSFLGMVIWG